MPQIVKPKRKTTDVFVKTYTQCELNTKEIIYQLIAQYDILLRNYNETNSSSASKRQLDNYAIHLKNANRLADFFLDYIEKNDIQNVLTSNSKTRELIAYEINTGALIEVNGLIRIPKTTPLENLSTSGNIIAIILPTKFINDLTDVLKSSLIDDSVRILIPCNNIILILEIGEFSPNINSALLKKIKKEIMSFTLSHNLTVQPSEKDDIIKYIIL